MEMKANYTLPEDTDPHLDEIRFVELDRSQCTNLIRA